MIHKSKTSDKVTLKIPRPLYNKISRVIEGSGYNSVTDFTVYVLRDLVASHDAAKQISSESDDIQQVKKRLRALGYLS